MRNTTLFFVFLCVHLFGTYHSTYACEQHRQPCLSATASLQTSQQAISSLAIQVYVQADDDSVLEENINLISIEDDNENEDIIKKHVSQARYLLACCHTFISTYNVSRVAERLPLCSHLFNTSSGKYITQRSLLI